jgi:integrase
VKVVQRHLGHATATHTLDRYAHLFTEDLEAVADLLDQSGQRGMRNPKPIRELWS